MIFILVNFCDLENSKFRIQNSKLFKEQDRARGRPRDCS